MEIKFNHDDLAEAVRGAAEKLGVKTEGSDVIFRRSAKGSFSAELITNTRAPTTEETTEDDSSSPIADGDQQSAGSTLFA